MSNPPAFWAVVPAAGVGRRMQAQVPKQYLPLAGQTVLEHTLKRLLAANRFAAVAVAVSVEDGYWPQLAVAQHPAIIRAPGGKERADSVLNALQSLSDRAQASDWVLVHDAARPCITTEDIHKLIETLQHEPCGGILALSSHDTLKQVESGCIIQSVDRSRIWRALTPQMFRYGALKQALLQWQGDSRLTDEASALELSGETPKIVEGRPDNIKITRPEDLALAAFYMEQQL